MTGGPHGFTIAGSWTNSAGRSSAVVWRSGDGRAWVRNDRDPSFVGVSDELPQAADVADSSAGVVVVGRAPAPTPADPVAQDGAIWWSGDGNGFTRVLTAAPPSPGIQVSVDAVRFAGGRYVAVGTASGKGRTTLALWTSADGQRWTPEPTGVVLADGPITSVTALALRGPTVWVGAVAGGHHSLWKRTRAHHWVRTRVPGLPRDGVRTVVLGADSSTFAVAAVGQRPFPLLWTSALK